MNCKQGDLAIVVSGGRHAGSLVRCLEFIGPVQDSVDPDDGRVDPCRAAWHIEPLTPSLRELVRRFPRGIVCEDRNLRPLRGLPETETTEQEQPCTA